jgi:hypothetical protein
MYWEQDLSFLRFLHVHERNSRVFAKQRHLIVDSFYGYTMFIYWKSELSARKTQAIIRDEMQTLNLHILTFVYDN